MLYHLSVLLASRGMGLEQRAAAVTAVAEHAAQGTLTVAHEVVPLADAGAAWQRQAEGRADGRIVLRP